ncbi:MAG: hypothetical protein V1766_13010 [Pseudomonadota bacterium]
MDKVPAAEQKKMMVQTQSAPEKAGEQAAAGQSTANVKVKQAQHATQKQALKTTYMAREENSLWWIAK